MRPGGVFDAEAQLGGTFLHPGGEAATELFLEHFDLNPSDQALELGCGLGATAALVAERTGAQVVAMDRSITMLRGTSHRLQERRLTHLVRLVRGDITKPLPFDDESFDAVYAESVVALVDPSPVLRECFRVLRPGGKLAINDRVWKAGVSQEQVNEVNALSKRIFGTPAATPTPLDRKDWVNLLGQIGFTVEQVVPTWNLPPPPDQPSALRLRLKRYHYYLFHPYLIVGQVRYKLNIRRYGSQFGILEGFLFFGRKPAE